ncbi:unnamed protein product [Peronospora belbahrii]|nr:unnamed protein product [Peronospora belbahrii]
MPTTTISTISLPENKKKNELDDDQENHNLDTDLGRLSRLSATFAIKLNQIHHIKICATYDVNGSGPTVYVMNVYLRYVQKGLPPPSMLLGESVKQRKRRLQLERERERPMYQVEHRYSAFRELRRRIMKIVSAKGENKYHQHCSYCSRVMVIDSSTIFPPRVPNYGLVASCTGWRQICTYVRKRQLERFVNQLLWAAKDMSYRTGSGRCERFLVVSQVLNSFLSSATMGTTESLW